MSEIRVPSASVIIRTHNDQRSLGHTLERVFDQETTPLEVIVADAGSTDRTLAIADNSDAVVLTIDRDDRGRARMLNRAARVARGDILVLLSARCAPADTAWLGRLLRHFDDPVVAGVWGPELGQHGEVVLPGPAERHLAGSWTRATWTEGLSSDNGAVRTRLWRQDPFDESLPALEDKEWARVMMDRGYCIVSDPAAVVRRERGGMLSERRQRAEVQRALALVFADGAPGAPVAPVGAVAGVSAADPSL